MQHFSILAVFCAVLLVQCEGQAQLIPRITRAPNVCCLKSRYSYTPERLSNPVTAVTYSAASVATQESNTFGLYVSKYQEKDIKSFPLKQSALTSDHCQISDVAVTVRRDGTWTLSCRATQNPNLVDDQQRPRFVRFSKNMFAITLRAYTDYEVAIDLQPTELANPAIESIPVHPFWLKRSQERRILLHDRSAVLAKHFDLLDRFEVDLQYE